MTTKTLKTIILTIAATAVFSVSQTFAQGVGETDHTEIQMIKNIYEALIYGNCEEAQQHYDSWKIYAGTYDMTIENLIANCSESTTTLYNEKTAKIPGTQLIVTRKRLANQVSWDDAKNLCDNLHLGGSSSWRLPTKAELYAIYASEVLDLKGSSTAKHVYMWGEKEGSANEPRYPTMDLKTGAVKNASKVSTIGCFCVTSTSDIEVKE